MEKTTMWLSDKGKHIDVRGKRFAGGPDEPDNRNLSQSEIIGNLRDDSHISRPYTLQQLIHDVENLTPEHLDVYAQRINMTREQREHRRLAQTLYMLTRTDDNGNTFLILDGLDMIEAFDRLGILAKRGHKQTYAIVVYTVENREAVIKQGRIVV